MGEITKLGKGFILLKNSKYKCTECGTECSEYFYKKDKETLCEKCILNIDIISQNTTTNYYAEGEYLGSDYDMQEVYDNICEIYDYEEVEQEF